MIQIKFKVPFLHSKGFERVEQEGECCGVCKQKACIYSAPDNTTHTLQVHLKYSQTFPQPSISPVNEPS